MVASDQALSASTEEIWTAPKFIVSSPAPMPHELTPMHDVLSEVKCWKWTRSWNLRTRNTPRALQFTPGRTRITRPYILGIDQNRYSSWIKDRKTQF